MHHCLRWNSRRYGNVVHMAIVWCVPAVLSPLAGITITVQVAAQRERLGLALLQESFRTWSNLTVFFSHKIIVHRGSVPTLHCLDIVYPMYHKPPVAGSPRPLASECTIVPEL